MHVHRSHAAAATPAPHSLRERFESIRATSVALVARLDPEDAALQSMPDASPAKWHPAHTSYVYALKRRHALHHHYDETANFGVTSGFWDHVFRTAVGDPAGSVEHGRGPVT